MNDIILEQEREKLFKMDKDTEQYKQRYVELSCIDMINSILAYKWTCKIETAEEILQKEEKASHNYLKDYTQQLGRDKVVTLIQNQMDDIERINTGVMRDSEGVSYNGIIWKS